VEKSRPGSFGRRLRKARITAGLTHEALAERSGISVDAISALENGRRRRPRADTVRLLAEGLGLSAHEHEQLAAAARVDGRPKRPAIRGAPVPTRPAAPAPAQWFVGRDVELENLRGCLEADRRVVVHGLAGVGKTQLVARYAQLRAADYPDGVFWLQADHETSLLEDLTGLAGRLGMPERSRRRREEQLEAVVRWLREHPRWLVVLDDLEPAVRPHVRALLPSDLPGHVVVTSRAPFSPGRIAVGPLPQDVAARFLLDRTGETDAALALEIAETLGCLPLALEQAAAYLEASGRDIAGYAELLHTRLLQVMCEGTPEDYPLPVVSTWRLLLERLQDEPGAVALLRLCAFLAPNDIPVAVLIAGARDLPDPLRRTLADDVEADRTIAALRGRSLMERRGDGLHVHRLLQSIVRESMDRDSADACLGAAIRLLRSAFPDRPEQRPDRWPLCSRLLAHVRAVEEHDGGRCLEPLALSWLLHRAGLYLDARGDYRSARAHLERALDLQQEVAGADHPDTAKRLNDLARVLVAQGNAAAARSCLERALATIERDLGPDHPHTATTLDDLAHALHAQGDPVAARPLSERALRIRERELGSDHPDTASSLDNLAQLLHARGELAPARAHLERALAIVEGKLGAEHPRTATVLHRLAAVLHDQGEPVDALRVLERAVRVRERVLGREHPETAWSLRLLATLRRDRGELEAARHLSERALVTLDRALGPQHPHTVESRRTLQALTVEDRSETAHDDRSRR
jgi:tetratricopeptide (TPR) repeat protein/transcriptional regulator with XRE-family HTH domain